MPLPVPIKARVNSDLEIRADYKQFPLVMVVPVGETHFIKHLPFERGNFFLENVPMDLEQDGVIVSNKATIKQVFLLVDGILKIKVYVDDSRIDAPYLISSFEYKNGLIENVTGPMPLLEAQGMFSIFYTFMMFVAFAEPDRIQVKTKSRSTTPGNSKSNKKKLASIVTITGVIKSYDDEESERVKRERQKHMESWGVRGHFRKLKSGEMAWVRPYKKGNGEEIKQTYRLPEKVGIL